MKVEVTQALKEAIARAQPGTILQEDAEGNFWPAGGIVGASDPVPLMIVGQHVIFTPEEPVIPEVVKSPAQQGMTEPLFLWRDGKMFAGDQELKAGEEFIITARQEGKTFRDALKPPVHISQHPEAIRLIAQELIALLKNDPTFYFNTMPNPTGAKTQENDSFSAQVRQLRPGECVARARAVDPTITVQRLPEKMPLIRAQVSNSVAGAVKRAKELNEGAKYVTRTGDCQMADGSLFAVVVVTREE